jgi:2-phosphoglycolate phosphatase
MRKPTRGVLFDLDGTLLDTAPDMAGALNALLIEQGLEALSHATIRPHVSRGARALVRLGFGEPPEAVFAERVARFLTLYRDRVALETRPFEHIPSVLDALDRAGIAWGIVTNKPSRLTQPLLEALGMTTRPRVVVSGDTFSERKPSPVPLLHAARQLGVLPENCIFLGDAECDMQAARAAEMFALGARYGYFGAADAPERWPADAWIDSPLELLDWVEP